MATIKNFKDLNCWKSARRLAVDIYQLDAPLLKTDWTTKDQIRRAALSVMNNIAEGFSRFSAKEQLRFYEIAQSSAAEVESMVYLMQDLQYVDPANAENLLEQIPSTRYQILAPIRYIKNRDAK